MEKSNHFFTELDFSEKYNDNDNFFPVDLSSKFFKWYNTQLVPIKWQKFESSVFNGVGFKEVQQQRGGSR